MKKRILLIFAVVLLLCGCNNSSTVEKPKNDVALQCVSNHEHYDGYAYYNGQYTYMYTNDNGVEGWSVLLNNPFSTEPATGEICDTVDGLPIVSAEGMYAFSNAESIDVSSFNSSNVYLMNSMFESAKATKIIGLDKLDTSNVINMSYMFSNTKFGEYDVSNFNTSKVYDMNFMFYMTNGKDYHIENFEIGDNTVAYGMFADNDNGIPNVYVNNKNRSIWNNLLEIETK